MVSVDNLCIFYLSFCPQGIIVRRDNYADTGGYLDAVGRDASVNQFIDYQSTLGQEIVRELEYYSGQDLPSTGLAKMYDVHQEESKLSPKEIMEEIEQKHQYLEDNHMKHFRDKDFGVEDFQGKKHICPDSYLAAVGKDESVNKSIDKESDIGKEIQRQLEREIERNRMQALEMSR